VPDGLELTVKNNTNVIVNGNSIDGYDFEIDVSGTITGESGSDFIMEDGEDQKWDGIIVNGNGEINFDGVTIKNAKRGLTLTRDTTAVINSCIFDSNVIGLHIIGKTLTITNTQFINNTLYGIKEDNGAGTVLNNVQFDNNLYDYYDDEKTVLKAEQLNIQ
jgi:hypothetical protein